jgi:hypothetical protein
LLLCLKKALISPDPAYFEHSIKCLAEMEKKNIFSDSNQASFRSSSGRTHPLEEVYKNEGFNESTEF